MAAIFAKSAYFVEKSEDPYQAQNLHAPYQAKDGLIVGPYQAIAPPIRPKSAPNQAKHAKSAYFTEKSQSHYQAKNGLIGALAFSR